MDKSEREAIEKARALLNKSYTSTAVAAMLLAIKHGAFDKAADHADILVAISMMEQSLEEAILNYCIKDDDKIKIRLFRGDKDSTGPLGSFWAKIQLARALGAIGPNAFAGLEKVRHIRNLFAHAKQQINFETQEVADLCTFGANDTKFWGGIAGPKPETTREKIFSFLWLLSLALIPEEDGVWKPWNQRAMAIVVG